LAVLFLVIVTIVLSLVQLALWWYSRDVAITAARAGVQAARADHAGTGAGRSAAQQRLARFGSTLDDQQVLVSADGARVTVTITGHVTTLLPGLTLTVTQSASGPTEEWTP
jgi:hypothetical protein